MKQSIVAIIRPNLNFSLKENQAAHLIEHILAAPKRLESIGISSDFYSKNIIFHSGTVNDFYLTEYYIVRSEVSEKIVDILLKYQNDLFIDRDDFEKIKSALMQEVLDSKGEFIDTGEQLAKAIFRPNSPSIRNPWDDIESIINLSFNETIEIFKKYNSDITSLRLSFDDYKIDKLPNIEKNLLNATSGSIKLWHPWQSPGSVDTYIMTTPPKNVDPLVSLLYRWSLTDYRFGLLFDELRNKEGLVYDISVDVDYNVDTFEIFFSSSKESSKKVINIIKKSLEKYDNFISNNFEYINDRLRFDIELDWGNIQNQSFSVIDSVISGGYTETPKSLIGRIDQIKPGDLSKFNRTFLDLILNNNFVSVKRQHGKSIKSTIK